MQGFGFGRDQPSHYWVEADGKLLDLGPHFLPRESSYPIARMPAVMWNLGEELPAYLRYRALGRGAPSVLSDDPVIVARCEAFVALCRERLAVQVGHLPLPTWLMTGGASVVAAARKKDKWATNALRFAEGMHPDQLRF